MELNADFEVRNTSNKGLGLFAKKTFEKNAFILEEKPIIAAQFHWNETYRYLACHHCLRPMESTEENLRRLTNDDNLNLPYSELCPTDKTQHRYCDDCGTGFCSDSCLELAVKEYHKILCPFRNPALNKLIDDWKSIHYPPETTSILLLAKIIGYIEQFEDKDLAVSTFLEFAHTCTDENEEMLMKFLGPEHSTVLLKIFTNLHQVFPTQFVKNFLTEDGLKKLFALVGRNGQGIGTSVFSEWVKRVEQLELSSADKRQVDNFIDKVYKLMNEHVGSFLNCEGSGLYKLQRIINHSCLPNASVNFLYSNSTLSIVATRHIDVGEEICISYLDDCLLERSRHTRRNMLRDYYLFECQCDKCIQQADEPDVTSEEESDDSSENNEQENMEM